MDCIYLDFRQAFDKVPHKRLLWKLEKKGGIKGTMLRWMEEFLVGRQTKTTIRGKHSEWKEVSSGVPQGSVLATIMYLIYINDLGNGIDSYINMFDDDAKIMRQI